MSVAFLLGSAFIKCALNGLNGIRQLKNVNNCLNTNIYSYLEISSGIVMLSVIIPSVIKLCVIIVSPILLSVIIMVRYF